MTAGDEEASHRERHPPLDSRPGSTPEHVRRGTRGLCRNRRSQPGSSGADGTARTAPQREDHLAFVGVSNDWQDVTHEDEAFFLRVHGVGDFRFRGTDLGILVTKARMQSVEGSPSVAAPT